MQRRDLPWRHHRLIGCRFTFTSKIALEAAEIAKDAITKLRKIVEKKSPRFDAVDDALTGAGLAVKRMKDFVKDLESDEQPAK